MFLPFDEWAPDRAALNTGMVRAINLLPTVEGYETAPSYVDASLPVIPERPMLVKAFRSSDNSINTFAFCEAHIYLLQTDTWLDVTRTSGPYTTDPKGFWFANQYADLVYAGNGKQKLQKFDMNGGTNFADVPESPVAKIGVIIRDFQVLFDTNDETLANATPYRMHWSGRLRPDTFTPSLVTQAGFRDVPDIGLLVEAVGGDYGLINGETGMQRIDYIGPPVQFQLSRVDEDVGCLYRRTMLKIAGTTYFFSNRGWRSSQGGPSQGIGMGKVDNYTRNRINSENSHLISQLIFNNRPVWCISYVSQDSTKGLPDEMIFYNYDTGRFSEGRGIVGCLGTLGHPSIFVDDTVFGEMSVDDPVFGELAVDAADEAKFNLIGVDLETGIVYTQEDSQPYAEIETREIQAMPGMRAQVTRTRLIGEGNSNIYKIRVIARDQLIQQTVSKDPLNKPERTGSVAQNRRGRYHRFNVQLTDRFKSLVGLEVDFSPAGRI